MAGFAAEVTTAITGVESPTDVAGVHSLNDGLMSALVLALWLDRLPTSGLVSSKDEREVVYCSV